MHIQAKYKDRILNLMLLGAISLLIASFTHSTVIKNTGQPDSTTYSNSTLTPLSTRSLSSYDPLPLVNADGSEVPQPVVKLPVLPIQSKRSSGSQNSGGTSLVPILPNEIKLPFLDSTPLPVLGVPLTDTVDKLLTPVDPVLNTVTDSLHNLL